MPTYSRLNNYLFRLNDIEKEARTKFGHSTPCYLEYIIREYLRYWRELQRLDHKDLKGMAWVRLAEIFNQQLYSIAFARLDMQFMIYEWDGLPLFEEDIKFCRD